MMSPGCRPAFAAGVYGALYGFRLGTRVPHFPSEVVQSLVSAHGKLTRGRLSLLGVWQRLDDDHRGAAPYAAPEATVDARERFRFGQARWNDRAWRASLGFADATLEAPFAGTRTLLQDSPNFW